MGAMINILVIAISAYLLVAVFVLMKRNSKNKQYIECIDLLDEKERFFEAINAFETNVKDVEFKTKAQIIKLYGAALHNDQEMVTEQIDKIDLTHILSKDKKTVDKKLVSLNEDSFYYYCFLTSFFLYKNGYIAEIKALKEKIDQFKEALEPQLFFEIYQASMDVYFDTDEHKTYFENVLNGEYSGLYAKQMIGLYKKTVACLLAKLELRANPKADLGEKEKDLIQYKKTVLGNKILSALGIAEAIAENDKLEDTASEEILDEEESTSE